MWANNGGRNRKPEVWWTNARGYIEGRIWLPDGTQRKVKQHRWIMECHLGRRLDPADDVHHLNGDKQDNRIENLQLIRHGEHAKLSNASRPHRKGYKLNLTPEDRKRRSDNAKAIGLGRLGRAAISKAQP